MITIEMKKEMDRAYRLFISNILGTLGHEIRNHLSVIREKNGLIHDLLEHGKNTGNFTDMLMASLRSIERQIDVTITDLSHLERFRFRLENDDQLIDLHQSVDDLISLMRKPLTQRRIDVTHDFCGDNSKITCNGNLLQFLIYGSINYLTEGVDSGTLRIVTSVHQSGLEVRFTLEKGIRKDVSLNKGAIALLKTFSEEIGINLTYSTDREIILLISAIRYNN